MTHVLGAILVIVMMVVGLPLMIDSVTDSRIAVINARANAESRIIKAESEARLDNSKAVAIRLAAVTPLTAVILFGSAGSLFGLAMVVWSIRHRPEQERVIERQIIYVLPDGAPRRQLWQALSARDRAPVMIEEKK